VALGLTLSLGLAVLLNQWLVGRGIWRLIIFSPHITTTAAKVLVWSSMYTPKYGIFANLFKLVGVDFPAVLVRRMKHTYPRAIKMAMTGVVNVQPLISHTYPLDRIQDAYEMAATHAKGVRKVIIRVAE
jgi:ABC-type sugar transport system permease subunit